MIKKTLLLLASIFLIFQTDKLFYLIHKMEMESLGLIIFIAWILNLFITGIFAFAGFAFPTQKLLPKTYYEIHEPKRLKKIYKTLRVDLFRKALLATLWKSKKQRAKYFNGKKDGIDNLETQAMKSEFGHLIPFVILCFASLYLSIIGLFKLALFTFLINFIGNFYPIILQRHHRMRIQILRKRKAAQVQ